MAGDEVIDDRDRVEITVPLDSRNISAVRVLCASLAADAGFSVDEIDDLRLAVSEAFSLLAERQPGGRLTTSFHTRGDRLDIELIGDVAGVDLRPDDLARKILDAVVDNYRFDLRSVVMTKRASEVFSA